MGTQIILYTGFAASLGAITYPFAYLGDTVFNYNMRLGSLGPVMKEALTIAMNVYPASLISYALPLGNGFGLPTGKTKLVIHSALIPAAAVILGLVAKVPIEGVASWFSRSEKSIQRGAQCAYAAFGAWLVYVSFYASRMFHLTLFA